VAGYTLVISRGYQYTKKRIGTSNYLFFQNLFYLAFMVFLILIFVHSIIQYKRREKINRKVNKIIEDIIDKVTDKN
jgi:hypothetical protein